MSTDTYFDLVAKRDGFIGQAQIALDLAEKNYAVGLPRFVKDARIYIDRASDALAEASRIDKMIGLL